LLYFHLNIIKNIIYHTADELLTKAAQLNPSLFLKFQIYAFEEWKAIADNSYHPPSLPPS
jgi:hypothetical protein